MTEKINKANKVLGVIRRAFQFIDREVFINLYKSMVLPVLEYANQVWSPRLKKHKVALENVQRRATRLVGGMHGLTYEQRLRKLKLPTLAYRRLRGDLIETFKVLNNLYDPEVSGFIPLRKTGTTRGHSLKIFKERANLNIRKFGFPHRVVDIWNSLPENVASAPSLNCFKNRLDRLLSREEIVYNHEANFGYMHRKS